MRRPRNVWEESKTESRMNQRQLGRKYHARGFEPDKTSLRERTVPCSSANCGEPIRTA
jgi:hypothetical protein